MLAASGGGDMKTYFEIDGLDYVVAISEAGDLAFALIGGASKKGPTYRSYDLFWDEPDYSDVDLLENSLKVFRKVKEILLQHLFAKRLWRLGFYATTERKTRIYRWLANRLAKELKEYLLVEYPPGEFNFYKQVSQVA
jgi:hypothetical protein